MGEQVGERGEVGEQEGERGRDGGRRGDERMNALDGKREGNNRKKKEQTVKYI